MHLEIRPTTTKTPEHVNWRHVVPALTDPGGDAADGQERRLQTQVSDLDAIAGRFPTLETLDVDQPTERRLECEIGASAGVAVKFSKKDPTSGQSCEFRGSGDRPLAMRSALTK